MSEFQAVVFSLNNQLCGADTSQIQEIIKYQDVSKVPDLPEFVDGIINLRGKVVPVINLNKRFRLGDIDITGKTKIIIAKTENSLIGFIVNDVIGILRFSDEDIEMTPGVVLNNDNKYLKGIGKKDGMLISMLDLSRILTESEVEKLDVEKLAKEVK